MSPSGRDGNGRTMAWARVGAGSLPPSSAVSKGGGEISPVLCPEQSSVGQGLLTRAVPFLVFTYMEEGVTC